MSAIASLFAGATVSPARTAYRGTLLGVACGNALGIEVESLPRERIAALFPNGVSDVDPSERSAVWDDDLAQTVLLAQVALEHGTMDADALCRRLVEWYRDNGRGIGIQTTAVVEKLAEGVPPQDAARLVWEEGGKRAAGNGAVMRFAPVSLRWCAEPDRLVEEAVRGASFTHTDPRCTWSTVAVSVALALVLRAGDAEARRLARALAADGAPQEVTIAIEEAADADVESLGLDEGRAIGYTLKAMNVGLWAARTGDDLEQGLVRVVNAGGDTDTNGAVAGAFLGARAGAEGIPRRWLDNIASTSRLTALADALHEAAS